MDSIWEKAGSNQRFPVLGQNIHTDVLIIGGGICGLLCAWQLQQAGIDYALAEAETICSGITKNTTAKLTIQHGLIYQKLLKKYGLAKTRQYYEANNEALKQYAALCKNIDCDFERQDSYVFALNSSEEINKEIRALAAIGVKADYCDTLPLPFPAAGAVRMQDQAQLDPMKFVRSISRDLNIYEHTRVRELVGTNAVTGGGTIQANKILVATHFPFLNKHGSYFIKLYQHRSYVLALKGTPKFDGMYVDAAQTGLSFRHFGELLLLGGGSHRTGKQGGGWQELREFAQKHYPQATEVAHWATQDCMSLDGIAYIGPYSASTEGLYVATGFNKWGMTSSMVSAMVLADLVQGKENPWAEVFSPSRSLLHPQLAVNALESTVNLLTPAKKRCPHLGCALKWNPQEHTWDCPCHGSRFTKDGTLIDNPATGDL